MSTNNIFAISEDAVNNIAGEINRHAERLVRIIAEQQLSWIIDEDAAKYIATLAGGGSVPVYLDAKTHELVFGRTMRLTLGPVNEPTRDTEETA